MHNNLPTKAVANGEPTYEGIGDPTRAAGWWQGNEAWSNLTAGGTMGVVYGVAALWQWKLFADEPGWPAWALDNVAWRDAPQKRRQHVCWPTCRHAFAGYDFTDMTKHPELAGGKPCVGIPGKFYVVYLPQGGAVTISGLKESLSYRWFNPKTAGWVEAGRTADTELKATAPDTGPWVLFVGNRTGQAVTKAPGSSKRPAHQQFFFRRSPMHVRCIAAWIAAAIIVFCGASSMAAEIAVERWQPQDFAFAAAAQQGNPFAVSFSADVSGPGGIKLNVPGFYDGQGTWKVRVSPTAEGAWSLVTHSQRRPNLDGKTAAFACDRPRESAESTAAPRRMPGYPQHFVFEDGTRFFRWATNATGSGRWTWTRAIRRSRRSIRFSTTSPHMGSTS